MNGNARHWCFTLNNYTDDDVRRLSCLHDKMQYILFAKEIGTDNGTPHLQGFVTFRSKLRGTAVKCILSERAHVEVAINIAASIQYCKKPTTATSDIFEFGEITSRKGKRTDMDEFKLDVKNGVHAMRELRERHSEIFAKYPRFCKEYVQDNVEIKRDTYPYYKWQADLNHSLLLEVNDREIIFVVDYVGNSGKSWFAHDYCHLHDNAQVLTPGKKADMAYALDATIRVLFVDVPRCKSETLQYDFLEDVKNRHVFSTKYEPIVKRLNKVHVVVLMNESPSMDKLSADRYKVINLSRADLEYYNNI